MRLPYVENPPQFESSEDRAILERVKQRRGERGLQPLDLTLLHAPPVADGWNSFLRAIRTQTTLPVSIRETAICRVAVLNKAWYEWTHHAPLLREGLTALAPFNSPSSSGDNAPFTSDPDAALNHILHAAPHSEAAARPSSLAGGLDEKHLAVMAFTDASTLGAQVPDAVFERLRRCFSERKIVEIVATVAAYNCVSRFLVALDVGEMNGKKVE